MTVWVCPRCLRGFDAASVPHLRLTRTATGSAWVPCRAGRGPDAPRPWPVAPPLPPRRPHAPAGSVEEMAQLWEEDGDVAFAAALRAAPPAASWQLLLARLREPPDPATADARRHAALLVRLRTQWARAKGPP